jgi:hypothetical protein
MIHPEVTLNGTSREALIAGYVTAIEGLQAAYYDLKACAPHGRDYQASGKLLDAVREHRMRLQAIENVIDELMELAEKLSDEN